MGFVDALRSTRKLKSGHDFSDMALRLAKGSCARLQQSINDPLPACSEAPDRVGARKLTIEPGRHPAAPGVVHDPRGAAVGLALLLTVD